MTCKQCFVIMTNDYPLRVHTDELKAEADRERLQTRYDKEFEARKSQAQKVYVNVRKVDLIN